MGKINNNKMADGGHFEINSNPKRLAVLTHSAS